MIEALRYPTALDGRSYPPVGRCIYCGTSYDLTKEHILPFGLSGTATLPKSSCCTCAGVTRDVEQAILRGSFWPVRVFRDLRSRTKHQDAPDTYPLTLLYGDREERVDIALEGWPILLSFPIFTLPRVIAGVPLASGIGVDGVVGISFGKKPEEVAKSYGATGVKLHSTEKPAIFARMIAKIAYSYACAEGALSILEGSPFVADSILGKSDDIGNWVGTLPPPYEATPGALHGLELVEDRERMLLLAIVHLFADSQTPRYVVAIGRLRTDVA